MPFYPIPISMQQLQSCLNAPADWQKVRNWKQLCKFDGTDGATASFYGVPAGGRAAGAAGLDCACMRIGMMSPGVCWVGWASAGWGQIRGYGVCGKQVRAVRTGLTVRVWYMRDRTGTPFLGEVGTV